MARDHITRRRALKLTGAAAASAALAGCSGGGSGNNETPAGGGGGGEFDGWFEKTETYDGTVVDETGSSSVTVKVGAGPNGFNFDPPAVKVSTGTTVTWKWTGKGSAHNVVAQDGSYESELVTEEGHTFEHTFDSAGTSKYFCQPHKSVGMRGAVVVE